MAEFTDGKRVLVSVGNKDITNGTYYIPDGITAIESGAFLGCTSLTSITLPEGITKIESGAFGFCFKLEHIYVKTDDKATIEAIKLKLPEELRDKVVPEVYTKSPYKTGNHTVFFKPAEPQQRLHDNNDHDDELRPDDPANNSA